MYQFYWKSWWKLYPRWSFVRDHSYEDAYPGLELYAAFFLFGPFQIHWWTCIPPLRRSVKWSNVIRAILLKDMASMAGSDETE